MQGGYILLLDSDIRMADDTLISHAGGLPESDMASGAVAAQAGVRRHSTQHRTCLGIQCAWAEKYIAARQAHHHYNQGGQQGRDKTEGSQAAKRFRIHLFTIM